MDWTGIGLREEVKDWLEAAKTDRYAYEKRLDPFATSMRDFDDVSNDLRNLRATQPLAVTDPRQRLTDLKNAGLVKSTGELSDLGAATLLAWEKYGVATTAKGDELPRLLLLALEARRIGDPDFAQFFDYWSDLRSHFDPLQLIHNWDALYAINYLDYERGGFSPGSVHRDEQTSASEIEFDLLDYAIADGLGANAVAGADRLNNAIGGKIPRGRHRSTFCMALELVLSGSKSAAPILKNFGMPKKPRVWTPFEKDDAAKIISILDDYKIDQSARSAEKVATEEVLIEVSAQENDALDLKLPNDIDFSSVLVDAPAGKSKSTAGSRAGSGGAKKTGYLKKSKKNDVVGRLAEEFAISYERWRLREHPVLLKKIYHASLEDDTLGYDIASFEPDERPRYVEVKGTLGPLDSRFFLSAAELAAAEKCGADYVILRVGNLQDSPRCCEVRYPFDDVLELSPAIYSVSFKAPTK